MVIVLIQHWRQMFQLKNKTYSHIQNLVRVILPVFASLYYCFGHIFEIPSTEIVLGSIVILIAFLGICLSIVDEGSIFDGDMVVEEREDGSRLVSLEFGEDPIDLLDKDKIIFKVVKEESHI